MAKIYGTHKCSICNKSFPWDYHLPNKLSDHRFDVEKIIPENVHATRISSIYSNTLELCVKCKYCGNRDSFIYNPDNDT